MGDFLLGGEKSGTPQETREGTEAAGHTFGSLFRGPSGAPAPFGQVVSRVGTPMQRLGAQSQMNLLGMSPGQLGLGRALAGAVQDPREATSGLFQAMQPFEERTRRRSVAQLRSAFGQQGGRFSPELLDAEGRLQGELSDRFFRSREEAFANARGQQIQALGEAFRGLLGAQELGQRGATDMLSLITRFLQPGPAVHQQGILPGLIRGGAQLGAAALLRGGGGGGGGQ